MQGKEAHETQNSVELWHWVQRRCPWGGRVNRVLNSVSEVLLVKLVKFLKLSSVKKCGYIVVLCVCVCVCVCVCLVLQSYLTLCDLVGYSPLGCSVHGILQARILEWVAISSSRGSSQPRDHTHVSCIPCIGRQTFYHWAIREALLFFLLS